MPAFRIEGYVIVSADGMLANAAHVMPDELKFEGAKQFSDTVEKLKAIIPPLEERVEIRRHMFNKELGSKLVYLTELQDLLGQQKEILVQESKLLHALLERGKDIFRIREYLWIGLKRGFCAALGGITYPADFGLRNTALVFLVVDLAIAADFDFAPL